MNKQQLIAAVAEGAGLSKAEAGLAVDTLVTAISDALVRGDEVRFAGFGTFSMSRRKASVGRNPRTGAAIKIDASAQPKFKAGKAFRDACNV